MSKIAFLFPGQGAQYVGMGQEIAKEFPEGEAVFIEADEALGYSLKKLCFEGPEDELMLTANTQPAIVATSLACLAVFAKRGPAPDYAAGLSLGEYSALVVGRSLVGGDAVALVRKRGQYMQEVVPPGKGAMAAIMGLSREQLLEVCRQAQAKGVVGPANFNCPGQIVISGEKVGVERAMELAKEGGAKRVVMLPVSAPFHSSLLKPAGEKMARELEATDVKDSQFPVVANVSGEYVTEATEIKRALVKQVSEPVLWEDTLLRLARDGVNTFIEIGPGKVLSSFVKKTVPGAIALNVSDPASLVKTLDYLEEVG